MVADRPKVLAEIRGRPFLAYLLDHLARYDIGEVVICTGYLGEQVEAAFGGAYGRIRLAYSREGSPLSTAGALRLALPLLRADALLVMNGDSFCETNPADLWNWHCARGARATVLLTWMADTKRYGRVHTDGEGRIVRFEEKPDAGGPGWISAGVYVLDRRLVLEIPKDRVLSFEREVFPAWNGRGLYGYGSDGRFLDIGTPEGYALAEAFFSGHAELT